MYHTAMCYFTALEDVALDTVRTFVVYTPG